MRGARIDFLLGVGGFRILEVRLPAWFMVLFALFVRSLALSDRRLVS